MSANTHAIANATPSANVSRPLHTSPTAATANRHAPSRTHARSPYTPSTIRSNSATETSADTTASARIPTSDASGPNSRL